MANKRESDKIAIDRIIREIAEMIIDGHQKADIYNHVKSVYKKSERQIDRYVVTAKEYIKEISKETDLEMISRAKLRLDKIYRKCYSNEEYKNAISAIRESSLLFGLHQPQKIKHLGDDENPLYGAPLPTLKEIEYYISDQKKKNGKNTKKSSN